MFWLVLIPSVIVLALFFIRRRGLAACHKWESQGVHCVRPYPLLGSYPNNLLMMGRRAVIDTFKMLYDDLGRTHDLAVYFNLTMETVLVNDPDLIREIMVKHFDHYVDRIDGTVEWTKVFLEVHRDMSKMLTVLCGEEWKAMRAGLSPAFTTGKMRGLVGAMDGCGPELNSYIRQKILKDENNNVVEIREVFGRYTMGVIAHAVYGIDARVFEEDAESEFVKNARAIQGKFSMKMFLTGVLYMTVPRLARWLGMRIMAKEPFDFFESVTRTIMGQREKEEERTNKRGDMLQLLVDLRDKKTNKEKDDVDDDHHEQFEADAKLNVKVDPKAVMTDDGIIQSSVLFLLAGFDTTANTLSLVSYHLATQPEVQERARAEVDKLAEDLAGSSGLSYDDLSRLEYLEMVVSETLRVTPIASIIERVCTRDHVLSNGVKVESGTKVQFAVAGLQLDSRYWEDPLTFDPERFSKENKRRINQYAYLPFGAGPRNCIGMRFAVMEVKVALFHLLRGFVIEPSEKTTVPPKFDKKIGLTAIEGGNYLKLVPRDL